jgi:chromosome segregation ATPase
LLKQQIALSTRDNSSLNAEMTSLRSEVTALKDLSQHFQNEKLKSEKIEEKSEKKLAAEKARFVDLEKEMKVVQDELNFMKEKNQGEVLGSQREKLEIDELRQLIAHLENEKETEAAKAQTLKDDEEKRKEKEKKESEKEEKEREIKEMERERATEHHLSELNEWKLKHDSLVIQLNKFREDHSIEVRDINQRNHHLLTKMKDDNDIEVERIKAENYTKVQEIKEKVKAKMDEIKDQNNIKVQLLNDLNQKLQEEARLSSERILSLESRIVDESASSSRVTQPAQQLVSAVGDAHDRAGKKVTSLETEEVPAEETERDRELDMRCEFLTVEVQDLHSLVGTLRDDLQASQTSLSDLLSSQREGERKGAKERGRKQTGDREGGNESNPESTSSSESECRMLKEEILTFQNQILDLRKLQESAFQQLESKTEELDSLKGEIEGGRDAVAAVTEELAQRKKDLSELKGEKEEESRVLKEQVAALGLELSASLAKQRALSETIVQLDAEVLLIQETVDSLEKENVTLRKEGAEKSARIAELEEAVRSAGDEIQDLRESNSSDVVQAEELKRSIALAEESAKAAAACGAVEVVQREKERQAEREAATVAAAASLSEVTAQLKLSTQTVKEKEALVLELERQVQVHVEAICERDKIVISLKQQLQEEQVRAEGLVESTAALRDAVQAASSETELLRVTAVMWCDRR